MGRLGRVTPAMIRRGASFVSNYGSACAAVHGLDPSESHDQEGDVMRDFGAPKSGRLEQILERVDFFKPVATRRGFMQKLLLAGGAAAAGAAGLSKGMPALADATTDLAPRAGGPEPSRLGIRRAALGS